MPATGGLRPEGDGVTDGFQVTMSDLLAAAGQFRAEARAFAAAMPASGPAPADGGSWFIDDALSTALGSIGALHTQLTATIEGDATALSATYDQYQEAEDTIVALATAVVTPPTVR
jgi:hypothetical protein